jgi:hypothetical protein
VACVGASVLTSSVSINDDTKREFDDRKPDSMTHDEFMQELLAAHARDNGEIVDVESIVEQINHRIASNVELASYRGTAAALDNRL